MDASFVAVVLFLVVAVAIFVVLHIMEVLSLKRLPSPPQPPPQPLAPPGASPAEMMNHFLATAPERFAKARQAEALRAQMACCVCGEATAIMCSMCDKRVCVGHRDDHPCQEGAA